MDGFSPAGIDGLSSRLREPKSGYVYHGVGGDWWDIYCQVTIEGERPLFVLDTADHTVALVYDSNGVEVLVLHDRITLLQEAENMTLKKWDYQHN